MVKTPICNSQICSWKVMVTGYTEYFRVQGTIIYCKVLGFTVVYWEWGRGNRNQTKFLFLITKYK